MYIDFADGLYSKFNLNQDKATKPQTVQIVRKGCTMRGHRLRLKVDAGYVLHQGERLQWLENG